MPGIQAIRALAVLLVLGYHIWPSRVPGGFVGVDIFFVISGFLITGHLVKSYQRDGRISLRRFYARRISRLLPAALLVLVVTGVAALVVVPSLAWSTVFGHVGAAASYVENWVLAAQSVDYLTNPDPSPVQHYWSLSVEEQFYLVWPWLIMGLGALVARGARRSDAPPRMARLLAVTFAAVLALSLAWSIVDTAVQPAVAYFSTLTRGWEFAAGALLALAPAAAASRPVQLGLVGAGSALVLISSFGYGEATAFPGYAAVVPVLGTVLLVQAARSDRAARWATTVAGRVVLWLGGISYSLYLWHWPLVTLWPEITGRPVGTLDKIALVALTVILAALTTRLVERPFRRSPSTRYGRSIFVGIATSVLILAVSGSVVAVQQNAVAETAQRVSQLEPGQPCVGAAAIDDARVCADPFSVTRTASAEFARQDRGVGIEIGRCELGSGSEPLPPCEFGVRSDTAPAIALFGDSHAGQLIEVLGPVATEHGRRLLTYVKGGCPGMLGEADGDECLSWGENAIAAINADPDIDIVVVANATQKYRGNEHVLSLAMIEATVEAFRSAGKTVVLVRDTPGSARDATGVTDFDFPACIDASTVGYDPCTVKRADVVSDDLMMQAANSIGVSVLDLTRWFCDPTLCHSVIGGLVVYTDGAHLAASYARTLAPYAASELERLGILEHVKT